jgi:DNA-binding beta-propeller fold protein YncE
MRIPGFQFYTLLLVTFSAVSVLADDKVETVLEALINPCGVAVQPETGHVFVSDSGAGRIIRVVDGKARDVITDFPMDVYGEDPKYDIGPLGLLFLDKDTLVVGGGGNLDGEELVRVYKVPAAGKDAIKADEMKESVGPLTKTEEIAGEGNFYAIAANETAIFVTSNGDDTKGWVARADHDGDGKLGELTRFIATKEATFDSTKEAVDVDAPVGITISPDGYQVVVGQMGEITDAKDSLLSFYAASDGTPLLNLETGLFDITSLAYSPKTGQLYALDFAWKKSKEGGLFRLDGHGAGKDQTCEAVKRASLDKPTAMAFGPDGSLYMTIFGTAQEVKEDDKEKDAEKKRKPGKLLKVAPSL